MTAAVLVVRRFDDFSRILSENAFAVINCPAIETVESTELPDLAAKISARRYDGIFLTSQRATAIACREIFCQNFNYRGKVYVLGKSSFEQLKNRNLDLFFRENANTAGELLAAIPAESLKNKRFLFIRGARSRRVIPDFLEKIAAVDEEIVYETHPVTVEPALKREIEAKSNAGEIAAACFFSPSGAESFLEQCGAEILRHTKIAAIGTTTADFLAERGLTVDFIPATATAEDFASELVNYLQNGKRKTENEK